MDREPEIAELLGRSPRGAYEIGVVDRSGRPIVMVNAPHLRDGTPMPTLYWLVGRAEREAVGRLESIGGVQMAEAAVDPGELSAAHDAYQAERDKLISPDESGPRPSGGVGGTHRGVKCLHAHLAWWLAGGADPVGSWTAERLGIDRGDYEVREAALAELSAALLAGGEEAEARAAAAGPAASAGVPVASGAVAAIDCGTNSTRLLVVGPEGEQLARLMKITRLGEGVSATGRLGAAAIGRTVEALATFREVLDALQVSKIRVTATSAARDAANAGEFSERVLAVLGVGLEVLEGSEEGRLAFNGATSDLDPSGGPYMLIDIGGGSTELVIGKDAADEGKDAADAGTVGTVSLELGCVRVTETYLRHDPPLESEMGEARQHSRRSVEAGMQAISLSGNWSVAPTGDPVRYRLVGVAGTVAALTALDRNLVAYDRAEIHHVVLTRAAVESWLTTLAGLSVEERRRWPGLEPERADVIVGGALVLAEAMAALGHDELVASESDLLDGVVAELLADRRDWAQA